MGESLNVLRTGRYETRVKDRLATVLSEATRQREIWDLSNEVNGCVEPVILWRRQHQMSANTAWISGHPGVTVPACGGGHSGQDWRDCISPAILTVHMELIKRTEVGSIHVHGSREGKDAHKWK